MLILSLREISGYLQLDTSVSQSRHMISLAIEPYSSGGQLIAVITVYIGFWGSHGLGCPNQQFISS